MLVSIRFHCFSIIFEFSQILTLHIFGNIIPDTRGIRKERIFKFASIVFEGNIPPFGPEGVFPLNVKFGHTVSNEGSSLIKMYFMKYIQ